MVNREDGNSFYKIYDGYTDLEVKEIDEDVRKSLKKISHEADRSKGRKMQRNQHIDKFNVDYRIRFGYENGITEGKNVNFGGGNIRGGCISCPSGLEWAFFV